jgi:uncharacterized protein YkwD
MRTTKGVRALLMRVKKQLTLAFITIFVAVLLAPTGSAAIKLTSPETALLKVMNTTRRAHGLAPLRVDPKLLRAARWQSADMAAKSYFDHGAFRDRMIAFGVRGPKVGENLAWGTGSLGTARGVVTGWLRSPEHRVNLLRPGYRRVGIGAAVGSYSGVTGVEMVTADFAGS